MNAMESPSAKPYLIRALYEWCTDNGLTPHIAVQVDESVQVPREYVKDGEIVLNVGFDATSALKLGNEFIEFKARFAGSAREIIVPIGRVAAIFARENGQGMAFPVQASLLPAVPLRGSTSAEATEPATAPNESRIVQLVTADAPPGDGDEPPPPASPSGGNANRPALKRIK